MINKMHIDAHYFVRNLSISFSENSPLPIKKCKRRVFIFLSTSGYIPILFFFSIFPFSFQLCSFPYNVKTSMLRIIKDHSMIETLNFHECIIIIIYEDYFQSFLCVFHCYIILLKRKDRK